MLCKSCGVDKEVRVGRTAKERGFHGKMCWGCVLEEQRAWRQTSAGKEYARLATISTRKKSQKNFLGKGELVGVEAGF